MGALNVVKLKEGHFKMAEYNQPKPVPVPNTAGYPNNVPNTQTKVKRGTGAAVRGKGYSKNSQ
jgi:hypothetical protein